MEPVLKSYYTNHQGMTLPLENRWLWNPSLEPVFQATRKNENQESWNPWSAPFSPWSEVALQEIRKNENQQYWNHWSSLFSTSSEVAFQEKKNNENRLNSPLAAFKNFSSAAGSLDEIQTKSETFVTDQSMIFQNIINENRLKNSKNFRPLNDFTSRKINRKNWKRMHQITNGATVDSFRGLRQQQGYQRWNHVPVLDWVQSTLPARSIKMNFQNSLQTGFFNELDKNPRRYQYSKRKKFSNISTNVSRSSPEKTSRANFKSSNLPNNTSIMDNAVAVSSAVSFFNSNKSDVKVSKRNKRNGKQLKSSSSMNFENEDDIIYLFSVDSSSEDKMVLEIDLESNGVHLSSNRNPKEAVNLTKKSKIDKVTEDQSVSIIAESESTVPVTSRKRKLRSDDIKASKRSNYMPRCTVCDMNYDDVIGKSGNMYISSSCTHVFCGFCISKGRRLEVCPACNIKFLSFRRLYM